MLGSDKYVERFKAHLKNRLIELEREAHSDLPALKKKLYDVDKEIADIQEILIETKSKSLGERLLQREVERDHLIAEIKKYENVNKQHSKVLLLANEYAKALKSVGMVLRKRSPGEQKTAIGLFLDRIEVMRGEGVA